MSRSSAIAKRPAGDSLRAKLKAIYRVANTEHSLASRRQRAVLGTTLACLAFEWSSGNEALIGYVGATGHELTNNALLAGIAAGGTSFIEQGLIGTLMALTIHVYPDVTATIRAAAGRNEAKQPSRFGRYLSAMILGSGIELAIENASRQHDRRANTRHALGSASMIAISNTAIVGSLSGLLKLSECYGLAAASKAVISVVANPFTYVVAIVGIVIFRRVKQEIAARRDIARKATDATMPETTTDVLLRSDSGITVTVSDRVPQDEYETFHVMVETGFQELNRRAFEKQDMQADELFADLASENVFKYVARNDDRQPVGLLLVHKGFDTVSWTDTARLRAVQESTDPGARPYYVGTIVIPTTARGTEAAGQLIRAALVHFQRTNRSRQEDSLVFFDCAEANHPWLARFIQAMGQPTDAFPDLKTRVTELYADAWITCGGTTKKIYNVVNDMDAIDKQHYFAITIER